MAAMESDEEKAVDRNKEGAPRPDASKADGDVSVLKKVEKDILALQKDMRKAIRSLRQVVREEIQEAFANFAKEAAEVGSRKRKKSKSRDNITFAAPKDEPSALDLRLRSFRVNREKSFTTQNLLLKSMNQDDSPPPSPTPPAAPPPTLLNAVKDGSRTVNFDSLVLPGEAPLAKHNSQQEQKCEDSPESAPASVADETGNLDRERAETAMKIPTAQSIADDQVAELQRSRTPLAELGAGQGRVSKLQSGCIRLVHSPFFDYASSLFVLLNAVTIGMQTDYTARNLSNEQPFVYRLVETAFCVIFTLELTCRIAASRAGFIRDSAWKWNLFDACLVGLQLADEIMTYAFTDAFSSGLNFSFMRVLKIVRLIRIMRIIRVLRLIGELRAIVSSILGSMKSLCWTILLLFMFVYFFGVYFTQLILDWRLALREEGVELDVEDPLVRHFGSLSVSILSLYQTITGGLNWADLSDPLISRISIFMGLVMAFYIAFAVLAILNIVTGVFVEAALKNAKDDHDEYMLTHLRELFDAAVCGDNGMLDWDHFESQLDTETMQEFFKSIDVDPADARSVFRLIDRDGNGKIDIDEFLNGCFNLQGPAKARDVTALMFETRKLLHICQQLQINTGCAVVDALSEVSPNSARSRQSTGMLSYVSSGPNDSSAHGRPSTGSVHGMPSTGSDSRVGRRVSSASSEPRAVQGSASLGSDSRVPRSPSFLSEPRAQFRRSSRRSPSIRSARSGNSANQACASAPLAIMSPRSNAQ
eukprot:TRINITY_DN62363_c0_g1_i1.p1 TRINITY_DN62363_c0_g1~~TRINITY_DN62363_c0_g1_i1.p1  ORF type:complete len:760 (+),score=143.25 TRINITY_DN62363_c0_g1_i1:40-2319(+)